MRSVNLVVLVGNVGNDPEVRMAGESRVAGFSMATTYGWGKGDERQEKTEWHRIVAWNALADLTEDYISKGSRLYIQGRVQYRQWEDKEGVTRYTTEIVASEIVLLSTKERSGATGRTAAQQSGGDEFEDFPGGDEDVADERQEERARGNAAPARGAPAKRTTPAKQAAPAKRAPAKQRR